jgi:hypothetical protein
LQAETPHEAKFQKTMLSVETSRLLFFQMVNHNHPEGNHLYNVIYQLTVLLFPFYVLFLETGFCFSVISDSFAGFESFTGRILGIHHTSDNDVFKSKITLKYWECSNGNGISFSISIYIYIHIYILVLCLFTCHPRLLRHLFTARYWLRRHMSPAEFHHVR